jgi:hypothetical protein
MRLLELRYKKLPIIDAIMRIIDDIAMGGSESNTSVFDKYGIDPHDNAEQVRRDIAVMDEFKVKQMYRDLVGRKS